MHARSRAVIGSRARRTPTRTRSRSGGRSPTRSVYVLDRRRAPVPIGVAGRALPRRRRPRARLPQPRRPDGRALRRRPVRRDARRAPVPDRRPRAVAADGVLDFLGRIDTQVKIRGVPDRARRGRGRASPRIPGSATRSCWRASARPATASSSPTSCLAGGRATRGRSAASILARAAAGPHGPGTLRDLAALPLTPNGKVDRRRSPRSSFPPRQRGGGRARDPLEARLIALWEDILGVSPVGVEDDFFALGGHSLDAVRLVQQIERLFDQRLPLSILHTDPTVENLARSAPGSGPDVLCATRS